MINFIKIIRPLNLLIIVICIMLSTLILEKFNIDIIPLICVIVLLAAFANVINDIVDYQVDLENQLNRPLSSGTMKIIPIATTISSWFYAAILFILALFVTMNFSFNTLTLQLIFYINVPLIILYTSFLKRIPLLGNCVVALNLAMVFVVSTTYVKGNLYIMVPPIIFSFLLMLIRELVKDIADLEGDKKFYITTFPVKFGVPASFNLFVILLIILIIMLVYYYFTIYTSFIYLISILLFIILPLLYYVYQFSKNKNSTYCIYLSKVLKLITIFGVIVIFLANFLN